MRNTLKILIVNIIGCLFLQECFSQELKIRYNDYLKGDVKIIGNSVVGRKVLFGNVNKPYNEVGAGARKNDQENMQYIDIDNDAKTFCSSSAVISLPKNGKNRIKYAGLYWSATYPYAEGEVKGGKYKVKKEGKESFNKVLLKRPNSSDYEEVIGGILFDGMFENETVYPYVVYADITDKLNYGEVEGEYFVGNVRSSLGYISGGVSAGWFLIVVYENDSLPYRSVTTYDGLVGVSKEVKRVVFEGFKTPEKGDVKAKLIGVGIEGDNSMTGDSFVVYSKEENKNYLQTKMRGKNDFFNSSITENDGYITDRKPYGRNTLGYDIFSVDIENNKNIIDNGSERLLVELSSKGDRYSVPFLGLSIEGEINKKMEDNNLDTPKEVINIGEKKIEDSNDNDKKSLENTLIVGEKKEVNAYNENKTLVNEVDDLNIYEKDLEKEHIKIQESVSSKIEKGYYNIAGVFENNDNANKFVDYLLEKGIKANSFYDTKNKYTYIYVSKDDKIEDAIKNRITIKEKGTVVGADFDKMWILSIVKK